MSTENQATSARAYLVSDFDALHKQRKQASIVGIVLLVIVFGYMTWLYSAVRTFSQPDNLAAAMTGYVEVSLPEWKRSAQAVVKEQAPQVAKYMGDAVVRELPPVLKKAIEDMVVDYTQDIAGTAVKHLEKAYTDVVTGAREELKQAASTNIEEDQTLILARAIDHQLTKASAEVGSDPFAESLLTKLEKSQAALKNLNDRMEKLLDPKQEPDTRRGKLERRFVTTFWRFMQQENPDLRIEEKTGK